MDVSGDKPEPILPYLTQLKDNDLDTDLSNRSDFSLLGFDVRLVR